MNRSTFKARDRAPLLLSLVLVLAVAAGLRYGLLEAGRLPTDCGGTLAEGLGFACVFKWALVQSFLHARLGWASLVFAVAALLSGRRGLAWGGWFFGLAGLVLYGFDPAAVGALLSLLLLLRRPAQGRRRQGEAHEEPADRLDVGRLA